MAGEVQGTRVVVLGGGSAGWMTAAALQHHLGRLVDVHVIESDRIGIVGVGEATLPHIRDFFEGLGVSEADFMKATDATYKLGIDFHGFGAVGQSYFHPFGTFGRDLAGVGFHHYWLRSGKGDIGDYSLAVAAARAHKFKVPEPDTSPLESTYGYAYQFDATSFGQFLRRRTIDAGARATEGTVVAVERNSETGFVSHLTLDDGRRIEGDLFVDCSGFRSLLLGSTLAEAWEDWSQWLPCDRAVAAQNPHAPGEIAPFTEAHAMPGGWRWRIPLRSRVGNGHVYSSAHISDDEACAALLQSIGAPPTTDPRILKFRAGRRARSWVSNVVGIGLASGFLEPLESTSLYLVQVAIARLIDLFPVGGIDDADRDEFNRAVDLEYDRVRDFLILHYHATTRDDSPFWNHVRTMRVPDSLLEKIEYWKAAGRVARYTDGLFLEPSWVAVLLGQGFHPDRYDPRADIPPDPVLNQALDQFRDQVDRNVAAMTSHREALDKPAGMEPVR